MADKEDDLRCKEIIRNNREALNLACKNNLSCKGRFFRYFYESLYIVYKIKKASATRMCKRYKETGDVNLKDKYIEDLNGFGKIRNDPRKRGKKSLLDDGGILHHYYNIVGQMFVDRVSQPSAKEIHFELTCKYDFEMSVETTRVHLKKRLKAQTRTLQYVLQHKQDKECIFDKIDISYVPLPQPLYPYRPDIDDLGTSGRVKVLLWVGINPPVAPAAPSYKAHLMQFTPFNPQIKKRYVYVNDMGSTDLYVYYAHLVPLPEEDIVVVPVLDDDFLSDLYGGDGGVMDSALLLSLSCSKPLVRKRKVSVLEVVLEEGLKRRGGVCVVHSDDECSNPDELLSDDDDEEEEGDDVNMDGHHDGASIHEEGDVVDENGNVIDEYEDEYLDDTEYETQPYNITPFM
jgi:hypothetical protein